jgi:hypothetical protein
MTGQRLEAMPNDAVCRLDGGPHGDLSTNGGIASWTAEHDGYLPVRPPVQHRRPIRPGQPLPGVDLAAGPDVPAAPITST